MVRSITIISMWYVADCHAIYSSKCNDRPPPTDQYSLMKITDERIWTEKASHSIHDEVIKWKHFPRYLPFVRGIHRSPVNSPHKGQWRGVLMFSLICAWINRWVNNSEAGDLRRHRGHYDVTVIYWRACGHRLLSALMNVKQYASIYLSLFLIDIFTIVYVRPNFFIGTAISIPLVLGTKLSENYSVFP